jgi:hypothetical protein
MDFLIAFSSLKRAKITAKNSLEKFLLQNKNFFSFFAQSQWLLSDRSDAFKYLIRLSIIVSLITQMANDPRERKIFFFRLGWKFLI